MGGINFSYQGESICIIISRNRVSYRIFFKAGQEHQDRDELAKEWSSVDYSPVVGIDLGLIIIAGWKKDS